MLVPGSQGESIYNIIDMIGTINLESPVSIKEEITLDNDWQFDPVEISPEIMKAIENSTVKTESSSNRSPNSPKMKRKRKRDLRVETIEKEKENSQAESFNQDIIESSQPLVILKIQSRNQNSEIRTDRPLHMECNEPQSSQKRESEEFVPDSCVESKEKRSGDQPTESVKRKAKKKRKLPSITDVNNDSNRDYNLTENENPDDGTQVELTDTNLDEDRNKSKTKRKRKNSCMIESFSPIKKKHAEILNDTDLSYGSPDVKTESEVSRSERKRKSKKKVKKEGSETLLATLHDSTSNLESDNEKNVINDTSEKSSDKKNQRKLSKYSVSLSLLTTDEDDEDQFSNTKSVRNSIPLSRYDKTSDDCRSEKIKLDKKCSKKNSQSFEVEEWINCEQFSMNTDRDCDAPDVSVKDLKRKTKLSKQDRKQRAKDKVEKKKPNTLLAMMNDNTSSSKSDNVNKKIDDSSDESLDNRNPSKSSRSKVRPTSLISDEEEEDNSSKMMSARNLVSSPKCKKTWNDSEPADHESEERSCKDSKRNSAFVGMIKSKKSTMDAVSKCVSENVSVKDSKTPTKVSEQDRRRTSKEKVGKKQSNTLLSAMNDDTSSSDSDNENKKIVNSSEESLDNMNLSKSRRSKDRRISLITSDEEEENNSSEINLARNIVPSSQCNETQNEWESVGHKSEEKISRDNERIFKSGGMIKKEECSVDTDSSCNSPNVSDNESKPQVETFRQERKHKAIRRVKKQKSPKSVAMIHDSEDSSDSDNEEKKIDDKTSLGRRIKLEVNDEKDGNQLSNTRSADEASDTNEMFDLEVEARDLEEMISALEESEQMPEETQKKLYKLRVKLRHTVPPQHQIETCAGSRGPTPRQKRIFEKFGPIKNGKFTPEEDNIIVKNWKSFCKIHAWDSRDVKPFLHFKHQDVGLVIKFSERQKFVQFLADGLPWRTLYSVYWRFRNIYQPHLHTRYTDAEDKVIIAHMENNSAIDSKNVRKFSELSKILNRTRASVWRRYRLLKKKRDPYQKVEWNYHLVKKMIKNLMRLTLSDDVNRLKDLKIPLVVWKQMSKKFEIDYLDLKQFWFTKLHMQLFCAGPVFLNDVKIKLIEYFHMKNIKEWWEIQWPNIVKHFDGMTTIFLSQIFNGLIRDEIFEGMELREILEHLYEIKKAQIQHAPRDKFLPRIIFKDGNVILLDKDGNDQRKRKPPLVERLDPAC